MTFFKAEQFFISKYSQARQFKFLRICGIFWYKFVNYDIFLESVFS